MLTHMSYICPICQSPLKLHQASQGYYCDNKHHFDLAKEGYLNLFPVQQKKSKEPGDSRAMMRARRNFLEAGFYQPMADAIAAMLDRHCLATTPLHVLDMGCGEGYYSRQLEAKSHHQDLDLHGADIAKNAILAAAKKQPDARFIVASNNRLPYSDAFFDVIFRVYAPSNDNEIKRLLNTDGKLLTVTPGPRHLWQLREYIYPDVKQHAVEGKLPEGFTHIETQRLPFTIQPDQEQRIALLDMTPFAWRAKPHMRQQIMHAEGLEIETDFVITLAQKSG